jgi:hypothetical protein
MTVTAASGMSCVPHRLCIFCQDLDATATSIADAAIVEGNQQAGLMLLSRCIVTPMPCHERLTACWRGRRGGPGSSIRCSTLC